MFLKKQLRISYGGNITLLVSTNPLQRKKSFVVINTDASSFESSLEQYKTGGQFATDKSQQHINILEPKAVRFGLKTLCKNEFNILIQIDK